MLNIMEAMENNKLVLAPFIAFVMIAMAATTIITQVYADSFCGTEKETNYQGSFNVSRGFPSLSIPPGYPPWTPFCVLDNPKTQSDH
jgi:hypothetical protein